MKNKIKRFSKGDFRMVRPEIVLPERNLMLTIGEGEEHRGSFILKNRKMGNIRGLVYSSSSRMHLDEQGFDGNPVKLNFTYNGKGLKPGYVEQGYFTIVCNGGEYNVDYTVIIDKPYILTTHGKIQNVRDFKKLALQDFSEAGRLFRSKDFYEVIKYEEPRVRSLYDNMRKWSLGEQAMEEFLVGIKQKESIFLTMNKTHRTFRNLGEATKEVIHFTKNTWGYMPVKVIVDGDFIQIARNSFSTDDFVGNLFDFSYIIHPDKIHAGNNYGSLTFVTPYESLVYEIMVADHKDHEERRGEAELIIAMAMKGFLSAMAQKRDLKEWAEETRKELSELDIYTSRGDLYPLINAQLYLLCGEDNKASEILDNYNHSRFALGKDSVIYDFYLYLTARVKKSGSYVNRVVEELNKAYMKNPKSWQLVCMLVEIDPEYKNYSKRLHALERHFLAGSNQIILYWLAYKSFLEYTETMKKLSSFEVQILNFAVKYGLLTKEVAMYMANLATQQRNFDKSLVKVLIKMYKVYDTDMILTAICTQLIRGSRTDHKYFKWYEKAVEHDLKIAQLYEYYMMSIGEHNFNKEFPKLVYLYFMHGNTLDYRKAAVLYANIITFQNEAGELYGAYREQMERFAWDQLRHRRISDTLRIIYKRCCTERDMNEERLQAMYDICHAYEVKTSRNDMSYVLVLESDGTVSQRVHYNPGGTVVFLYNKDSRIVWESKEGRHYVDSIPYDTMRLFYENRYLEMCDHYLGQSENATRKRDKEELTWDKVVNNGTEEYEPADLFKLCKMKIHEDNYMEDEVLNFVCFDLFKKGEYDKTILTYLAEYYCGATSDMKNLWHVARDYDVTTYKLSERIITQMMFSEMMFGEEEIFADYYEGKTYFRLKQAYLAYVSREYVVYGRQVKGCIFAIIANEYRKEEELADICKIALLKYYSSREVHEELAPMLREFLREMCEKQIFFSFYLNYPEHWLREVQLYDKTMIEYHAKPGSKVEISYQIRKDDEDTSGYTREVLLPAYEDTYIKTLILFCNESVRYFFTETRGENVTVTEKKTYGPKTIKPIGRYGRLNDMIYMEDKDLSTAMTEFAVEKQLANEIFGAY